MESKYFERVWCKVCGWNVDFNGDYWFMGLQRLSYCPGCATRIKYHTCGIERDEPFNVHLSVYQTEPSIWWKPSTWWNAKWVKYIRPDEKEAIEL